MTVTANPTACADPPGFPPGESLSIHWIGEDTVQVATA